MPRGWAISPVDLVTLFLKPEVIVWANSAFIRSEQLFCLEWIGDWRPPLLDPVTEPMNFVLLFYHVPYPLFTFLSFVFCFLFPSPGTPLWLLSFLHLALLFFCCLKDTLCLRAGGACPSQHRWRKSLFWGTIFATPYLDASDLSSSP